MIDAQQSKRQPDEATRPLAAMCQQESQPMHLDFHGFGPGAPAAGHRVSHRAG